MPPDIEDIKARLRRLEAHDEIARLIADFRYHIDQRDFSAVAALFHKSGRLVSNLGTPATGPREIQALLARTLERHAPHERTLHVVGNSRIDVDGDEGTAYSTWCYVSRTEADQPILAIVGRYSDSFKRERDGWRFSQRAIFVDMPFDPDMTDLEASARAAIGQTS